MGHQGSPKSCIKGYDEIPITGPKLTRLFRAILSFWENVGRLKSSESVCLFVVFKINIPFCLPEHRGSPTLMKDIFGDLKIIWKNHFSFSYPYRREPNITCACVFVVTWGETLIAWKIIRPYLISRQQALFQTEVLEVPDFQIFIRTSSISSGTSKFSSKLAFLQISYIFTINDI